MKLSYASGCLAVSAICAQAAPLKRAVVNDDIILNFALTLEFLEVAFYTQGLNMFSEDSFAAAGLPAFARGRFEEILANEQTHAAFLSGALGPNATQPCTYNFPFSDAKAFASLSATLEGVGASAYTGAANLLSDATLVTEAASILATEARQAAFVNSAVNKKNPISTSFETPLDLNQAFTLASAFIVSCPSSNPALPVKAFPALTVKTPTAQLGPGKAISVSFTPLSTTSNGSYFLAFLSGLDKDFVPLVKGSDGQWTATVPSNLKGTVYALVTSNEQTVSDEDTVAGVAILEFAFDSNGNIIN